MNERLKQLALEAGIGFTLWDDSGREMIDNYTPEEDLAKFAELILEECAKLNRHQYYELLGVITDVEEGDGFDDVCLNTLKRVAEHLANDLKEHFGVEE
jgi:iron-sulfur cluster repair protein YtfE (RIC family)